MKKVLNIGILAHVDAGKTTITEQLLYKSNTIKEPGRVDHGSTITDSLEVEKKRGITIKSTTVNLVWKDIKINILDTPGHLDFIAEVERSINVLDAAVLVISAKEGIQAQTRVLLNVLKKKKLPTIIFINKLDCIRVSVDKIIIDIKGIINAIQMQHVDDNTLEISPWAQNFNIAEENMLLLSDLDHKIYEKYIDCYPKHLNELNEFIIDKFKTGDIFPIYFGIGLKGIGITELLDLIIKIEPEQISQDDFYALVYKIMRHKNNKKDTFFRIFNSTVSLRQNIYYSKEPIKIRNLKTISGYKLVNADILNAGEIGIIESDYPFKIGDILGNAPKDKVWTTIAEPVLLADIMPKKATDRKELLHALNNLAEEDPFLQIFLDNNSEKVQLKIFGEIQKEVIIDTLQEQYNLETVFLDTVIVHKERPKSTVSHTIEMNEYLNPYKGDITFTLEPLPLGHGIKYESKVSYGYLSKSFQSAVKDAVYSGFEGIYGWELTDFKVTFEKAYYDGVKSTPSDFRNLAYLTLREAIGKAQTQVLEPIMSFTLYIPLGSLNKALSDLNSMGAEFILKEIDSLNSLIKGEIPLKNSINYEQKVSNYTGGLGVFNQKLKKYCISKSNVMRNENENDFLNRANYILSLKNNI